MADETTPQSTGANAPGSTQVDVQQLMKDMAALKESNDKLQGANKDLTTQREEWEKWKKDQKALSDKAESDRIAALEKAGQYEEALKAKEVAWKTKEAEQVVTIKRHVIGNALLTAAVEAGAHNPKQVAALASGLFDLGEGYAPVPVAAEFARLGIPLPSAKDGKMVSEAIAAYLALPENANLIKAKGSGPGGGGHPPSSSSSSVIPPEFFQMSPKDQKAWADANPDAAQAYYESFKKK